MATKTRMIGGVKYILRTLFFDDGHRNPDYARDYADNLRKKGISTRITRADDPDRWEVWTKAGGKYRQLQTKEQKYFVASRKRIFSLSN